MKLILDKYDYKEIKRTTLPNGIRYYNPIASKPLPSVTTILSETGDKSFLAAWRDNMGHAEADAYVAQSVLIGNHLHDNLEQHILQGKKPEGPMLAKMLTQMVIDKGLSKLDEIWGTETPLYLKGIYAGTTDLVGVRKGVDSIMDFKNSRRFKRREYVEDYLMQLCAYGLAHNEMFGTNIRSGTVMIACWTDNYLEYTIEGNEWDEYCVKWAKRVEEYYNKQDAIS